MEHESDNDTSHCWKKIKCINGRLEEELKLSKPEHYKNRLEYLEESWRLRRLAVTQTPMKNNQLDLV